MSAKPIRTAKRRFREDWARSSNSARCSRRYSGEHGSCPKRRWSASDSILRAGAKLPQATQMVLNHLRNQARKRQRVWLGIPLLGIGLFGAATLSRLGSKQSE